MNRKREATARRLSALAANVYADAGCPGAYVRLTDTGYYELHEPSSNASPIVFRTAAECETAIRQFASN
jgi:hypothetical protein